MLDAKVKVLWLFGLFTVPILLGIYTAMLAAGGATASFSFGHFIGTCIGNLVVGSLPAFIAAMMYRFKKEKQKNIYSVWTAGILITSLLMVVGTLKL